MAGAGRAQRPGLSSCGRTAPPVSQHEIQGRLQSLDILAKAPSVDDLEAAAAHGPARLGISHQPRGQDPAGDIAKLDRSSREK